MGGQTGRRPGDGVRKGTEREGVERWTGLGAVRREAVEDYAVLGHPRVSESLIQRVSRDSIASVVRRVLSWAVSVPPTET